MGGRRRAASRQINVQHIFRSWRSPRTTDPVICSARHAPAATGSCRSRVPPTRSSSKSAASSPGKFQIRTSKNQIPSCWNAECSSLELGAWNLELSRCNPHLTPSSPRGNAGSLRWALGKGMKAGRTRVLVVEDEQDIAGLIKHALEREGAMEVETAASGDTALKAVNEDLPDLIVLDLNLPVLSGVEVCRILRARPETAKAPIIMLTARSTESDRITGLDVGADDYITKPFSLRELAARVRAVLRRRSEG